MSSYTKTAQEILAFLPRSDRRRALICRSDVAALIEDIELPQSFPYTNRRAGLRAADKESPLATVDLARVCCQPRRLSCGCWDLNGSSRTLSARKDVVKRLPAANAGHGASGGPRPGAAAHWPGPGPRAARSASEPLAAGGRDVPDRQPPRAVDSPVVPHRSGSQAGSRQPPRLLARQSREPIILAEAGPWAFTSRASRHSS